MKKRILSMLVLLTAVVTGAWSQTNGALNGQFTINANAGKVMFSKGNLQYKASTDTWRFAENQFDIIGNANANISSTYDGWIDLFGWGTGDDPTKAINNYNSYSTYVDWGTNAISNGGNKANLWRTLTKDEWVYLFFTRTNAANLFGLGSVNGQNGAIILPDNWTLPDGATFTPSTQLGLVNNQGIRYTNSNNNNFSHNTYTTEQWAVMEQSGAVFLPAAGGRVGTKMSNVNVRGYYYTPTEMGGASAYILHFLSNLLNPQDNNQRHAAQSVRLVQTVVYTVKMKDGTEDKTNWTIEPTEATTTGVPANTQLTVTYSGTKKVKSVKVVNAVSAVNPAPISLTKNADGTVWTLASMPDYEVELKVEYYTSTPFDLTLADGSEAYGTVTFTVDGVTATQAEEDDIVTMNVVPNEGYSVKDVTVIANTSWGEAHARAFRAPAMRKNIDVTAGTTVGTWLFTMPDAKVEAEVSYTKNLQDAWIQNIAAQTYTGEALQPTVVVKDGSVNLIAGTDYTINYTNNISAGTATVTLTGIGNYSGTASKTFEIQKANITMTTVPLAIEDLIYSGLAQTLVTAGSASFGTVLYSTDGTTFNAALPQGIDAGTYIVYYKVEGDANHNAFAVQNLNVTIATNKTELISAINDAEEYYNTIKDSNPDVAATLLAAINAAKDVKNNNNATQTEIEAILSSLGTAVTTAQTEVFLNRTNITIPAKSYMSCIDADKRQIETAVSGVSLYSVKSVTDTEVVLTSALDVVGAEMPFLIYNNNDEEKTISIVVSNSDADNVTYDSEHFKGTLTDKTFSVADMQSADHYVLNGHNFVWVKDAGTLAAGKCWIELVSTLHARSLTIVFDDEMATGINTVNATAEEDGAYYTIDGRRVAQPTKGVYIVNGKKVVVK